MSGSELDVKSCMQNLIDIRKPCKNDSSTIIFFDDSVRVHARNVHPSAIQPLPKFRLGGTNFTGGFQEIERQMQLADDDQIPVIVFLTDGQSSIASAK